MFIWQYIDIPEEEIKAIQQEVRDKMPDNEDFFQTIELERKTFMGLELNVVVLIQAAPGFGLDGFGIHRDADDEEVRTLAINIPLDNCDESTTKFWKTNAEEIIQYTPNGMPYRFFERENCEEVTEFKLTKPVIFSIQVPHSVINPQPVWRRAISLRFEKDPWHLVKNT
jgi:hypothetical protein